MSSILAINEPVSYYSLILIVVTLFCISINFKISKIFSLIKNISNFSFSLRKKDLLKKENSTKENIITQNLEENKEVQDSLPFENKIEKNIKRFFLPELKFLKSASRNEKTAKINENIKTH